jgi:hypothetical protein
MSFDLSKHFKTCKHEAKQKKKTLSDNNKSCVCLTWLITKSIELCYTFFRKCWRKLGKMRLTVIQHGERMWGEEVRRKLKERREGPQQQQQQRIQKPSERAHSHTQKFSALILTFTISLFFLLCVYTNHGFTCYLRPTSPPPLCGKALRRSFDFGPHGTFERWLTNQIGELAQRPRFERRDFDSTGSLRVETPFEETSWKESARKTNLRVRVKVCCRFMTLLLSLRCIFYVNNNSLQHKYKKTSWKANNKTVSLLLWRIQADKLKL